MKEPHNSDGDYDLIGPNGDVIVPQVWGEIIEPYMVITMHMWSIPEQNEESKTSKLDAEAPSHSARNSVIADWEPDK